MLGVIGAINEEVEAIISEMSEIKKEITLGMTFYIGKFMGKDIVFVQSGIGKVNAAITATILIERYSVEKVIFSGVAGSLDERMKIGDVVIGTDIVQHDVDATEFGYKKGQIPQVSVWSFKSDIDLIEKSKKIKNKNLKLFYGRVITGDQFINKKDDKIKLGLEFEALCVDMESGAVAQVYYKLNKKFLIIRSISDSITDESTIEYNEFVKLAANNSKEILKEILS